MIIARAPLRIGFVGGGTDMQSYYTKKPGAVLSTTINKYVYIFINESFDHRVRASYSVTELTDSFTEIEHPLIRNAAKMMGIVDGLEIVSVSDIPSSGSGLGSSSAFSVALIEGLSEYRKKRLSKETLAEMSCDLEIKYCGEPIGKQDQYASAFGGFNVFRFNSDHSVDVKNLKIDAVKANQFKQHLLFFYTGITRSASSILSKQTEVVNKSEKMQALSEMASLVDDFEQQLVRENYEHLGELLHINWQLKRSLVGDISNSVIDQAYQSAMDAGAWGGKLLGAGAGGFMLFLAPPSRHAEIIKKLNSFQLQSFEFENIGAAIIQRS